MIPTNDQFSRLSQEDIESLRVLRQSPHWAVYRKLLIAAKEANFLSILPENDTNSAFKKIGMVAGINYAINQLPLIIDQHDAKVKKNIADISGEGI